LGRVADALGPARARGPPPAGASARAGCSRPPVGGPCARRRQWVAAASPRFVAVPRVPAPVPLSLRYRRRRPARRSPRRFRDRGRGTRRRLLPMGKGPGPPEARWPGRGGSPDDARLALEQETQRLRLELEERDQALAELRRQVEHLRLGESDRLAQALRAQME